MKLILTESQYRGMLKQIKDYEEKLSFMKQNLSTSVKADIFNHLFDKYKGEKSIYGKSFQIELDGLRNVLGGRPMILVWVDVINGYVRAMITIGGIRGCGDDKMTTIKWLFEDENGEETFYSKLDKGIQTRMSQKYQDKMIEKYNSRQ